jgi:hypothetical protein
MKKTIIISLILLAIFLSSGSAFAWRGHYRGYGGHFGFIVPTYMVGASSGLFPRVLPTPQLLWTKLLLQRTL